MRMRSSAAVIPDKLVPVTGRHRIDRKRPTDATRSPAVVSIRSRSSRDEQIVLLFVVCCADCDHVVVSHRWCEFIIVLRERLVLHRYADRGGGVEEEMKITIIKKTMVAANRRHAHMCIKNNRKNMRLNFFVIAIQIVFL
jgi:hypothetical protein